jgi:hypothetical protein
MGLAKADILTFLNAMLNRSETDIDTYIKACLDDLADENLLVGSATSGDGNVADLASGSTTIALPDNYKEVIAIKLNDGTNDGPALKPIGGGFKEYRDWMEEEGASDYDEPEWYVEHNGLFYVYHPSDGVYTPTIDFYKYHPTLSGDTGTILFGDEFKSALNFGACWFYAVGKGLSRYINIWGPLYANEKLKREANMKKQPYITQG